MIFFTDIKINIKIFIQYQLVITHNCIQRGPDLMTHHSEETALGLVGGIGASRGLLRLARGKRELRVRVDEFDDRRLARRARHGGAEGVPAG